jgi:hypothetical protein
MNPAEAMYGALESGVRTAYQVIDEYMRRGYEAAGNNHRDPNRGDPMNGNKSPYIDAQNPWGAMSQLTEQWLTAMRAWTEAWSTFIPGNGPTPWNPVGRPVTISVRVLSARPAEVTANLRPGADLMDLVADALQSEGNQRASIDSESISITREPGRVRVNVKVSIDRPAGIYRGPIRNRADGNVAGDLTVTITENPE